MKISLVVTAYDRQSDLDRFAAGLAAQTFPGEIELIYVAQGSATLHLPPNDCRITLKQLHTGCRTSSSKARNLGAAHISGDIVSFPDDDCWYGPNVLTDVARYFDEHLEVSCICTNKYDPVRKLNYGRRPVGVICEVTFFNLFRLPIWSGIFLRRGALNRIGAYIDERLGVGAEMGSGEETEFVGRLLTSSQLVRYVGTIQVFHPVPIYSPSDAVKSYRYCIGFGYLNGVYLLEGHAGVLFHLLEILVRSFVGTIVYWRSPVYRSVYRNRIKGTFVGLARSLKRREASAPVGTLNDRN